MNGEKFSCSFARLYHIIKQFTRHCNGLFAHDIFACFKCGNYNIMVEVIRGCDNYKINSVIVKKLLLRGESMPALFFGFLVFFRVNVVDSDKLHTVIHIF